MKKRVILVTGGCGYIGSHVTRMLSERGDEVVVIDNLSTGSTKALIHGEKFYEADIRDKHALAKIFSAHKFDAVLHFAASLVVPESVEKPLEYYQNNVHGAANVLEEVTKHGVPSFVFSSTAAIYGDLHKEPVSETDAPAPMSPYAKSKLFVEEILGDLGQANKKLRYVILRYFNVAGADPELRIGQRSPKATHLIKVACEAALGKRPELLVFGNDYETKDGTGVRDYIHVEDLAAAHVKALDYLEAGGKSDLFNCGYGRGYSVLEVANMVKEVSGVDFKVTIKPRRPGDVASVIARCDLIKSRLGWQPEHDDLRAIVRTSFLWEKQL